MRDLSVISVIFGILLMLSCGSTELPLTYNNIRGSGSLITVPVENLGPFHSVRLNTVGDVNLMFGVTDTVTVTINHNLFRFITTEVDSTGTLVIGLKTPKEVRVTNQSLTVDITMSTLRKVTLGDQGVGTIRADSTRFTVPEVELLLEGTGDMSFDLNVDHLTTTHLGEGNITLSGTAQRHELELTGIGEVQAYELATDSCFVTNEAEGDIRVQAVEYINAEINGSGNVYYRGSPAIDVTVTGTGELIDDN